MKGQPSDGADNEQSEEKPKDHVKKLQCSVHHRHGKTRTRLAALLFSGVVAGSGIM
jgi:hypothetical protein